MCVAMLLFINICLMAAQLQYLGLTIGHNIGYANYNYAAEEAGVSKSPWSIQTALLRPNLPRMNISRNMQYGWLMGTVSLL